jgi:hypothetical protein
MGAQSSRLVIGQRCKRAIPDVFAVAALPVSEPGNAYAHTGRAYKDAKARSTTEQLLRSEFHSMAIDQNRD